MKEALRLRGLTIRKWASANDIGRSHLYYILQGKRRSSRIEGAIADLLEWAFGPEVAGHHRHPHTPEGAPQHGH